MLHWQWWGTVVLQAAEHEIITKTSDTAQSIPPETEHATISRKHKFSSPHEPNLPKHQQTWPPLQRHSHFTHNHTQHRDLVRPE